LPWDINLFILLRSLIIQRIQVVLSEVNSVCIIWLLWNLSLMVILLIKWELLRNLLLLLNPFVLEFKKVIDIFVFSLVLYDIW
jgi:hypothetical protein